MGLPCDRQGLSSAEVLPCSPHDRSPPASPGPRERARTGRQGALTLGGLELERVEGPPRRVSLPPGWPLYVLVVGYPLWWVLVLSNFGWTLVAIPMLMYMVSHKVARVPRRFGIWLLFLTWMLLSSLTLSGSNAWLTYIYRVSAYLAATVTLLYILSVPRDLLPTRRLVLLLTDFWLLLLAGGYLGLVFARVSFPSIMEKLLPRGLVSNDYVYSLIHPRF